jgi:hypothetical protein
MQAGQSQAFSPEFDIGFVDFFEKLNNLSAKVFHEPTDHRGRSVDSCCVGPYRNAVKYFEAVKTGVSQIRGI